MPLFFKREKNTNLSDQELIALYKEKGEIDFLGDLFERYMHLVYGVCMKYLKDEDASKDTVMQVFEKLIDSLKQHNVENFSGWLHVTTKNHCLMILRKKKEFTEINNQEFFMESEEVLHPDDEDPVERDLSMLEEALEALQDDQKECIRLFYLEKRSYKEIEGMTGYDYKSIKSHIQNGRRNLKLYFERKQ